MSFQSTELKQIRYPPITAVPEGTHRPLWSVMIPTYNGTQYLEQTLRSVLEQDPGSDQMQIEVIDDCSTADDSEALVKEIGQGRVSFFRQPQNVGLIGNWNACIERASGHWVHILHQDDIVLPGFYQRLREGIETNSSLGAVFCRHAFVDEDAHWKALSPIERRSPGILDDWIERIAVTQLIQFPSIVVNRAVYENLGGFCAEAHYAADWEMWKRISAHYSVWYEPQILACYRVHSASETSRLIRTGADVADVHRAIAISEPYLPGNNARALSYKAREHCALYALNTANQMICKNDWVAALAQIRGAFNCSKSARVLFSILSLSKAAGKQWLSCGFAKSNK